MLHLTATLSSLVGYDALTLTLRLSYSKLLGYEAVFDDLVNVFFLCKWAFVVKVNITHLLADIGLMNTLGMMPREALIDETLADKAPIYTIVRSRCPLLMASRFELVFI